MDHPTTTLPLVLAHSFVIRPIAPVVALLPRRSTRAPPRGARLTIAASMTTSRTVMQLPRAAASTRGASRLLAVGRRRSLRSSCGALGGGRCAPQPDGAVLGAGSVRVASGVEADAVHRAVVPLVGLCAAAPTWVGGSQGCDPESATMGGAAPGRAPSSSPEFQS